MIPMRVSVTTLESFRLYMNPEQNWMPESELLATIRGEFVPTPATELGKAFGEVIEKPEQFYVAGVGFEQRGFTFPEDMMQPALDMFDRRGTFETKITKPYGAFVVVGKADHVFGRTLNEIKATLGSFDFDKYADSCQWRFYFDMFEAALLRYHVFCLHEDPDQAGWMDLKGIHSFSLYPYAALRQDLDVLLREFRRYVKLRNLESLLQQKQVEAEARNVLGVLA